MKNSENIQSKAEIDTLPQPTETSQIQDNKIQLPTNGKIELKGVSFSYSPQVFSKVEPNLKYFEEINVFAKNR